MYNNQGSYGRGAGSRRPYDSGGGRGGGGYSDRGRRPGFQGRGNQRFDNAPRPTESKVSTNHFPLQVKNRSFDPPDKFDFVRYKVVIKGLKWAKEIDPETKEEKTDPKNGKVIKTLKVIRDGDDDERYKKRFFNGPYPWRVMKQIVKDHGLLMEVS